jgi:hypothetical protein
VLLREPLTGTTVHTSPGTPGHLTLGVPVMGLLWALAATLSSLLVAVKSSPRALSHVELAKMMGGCYPCGTGGMLLAVSIAFSDRTESQ